MFSNNTDKQWELWGQQDPYYGVLTKGGYHKENLTPEVLKQFFTSGQRHLDDLIAEVRLRILPQFHPKRALDFGCGVGRVLIPLAQLCDLAVGVDVSVSMLDEAQKNCAARQICNVSLIHTDDISLGFRTTFDFIHSHIVFQHIPPKRGLRIVEMLLGHLEVGGVGALHFHYHSDSPPLARLITWAYDNIPLLQGLRNVLKGQPFRLPRMQMNVYNLNRVLFILQQAGCTNILLYPECKRMQHGVMVLFRKGTEG